MESCCTRTPPFYAFFRPSHCHTLGKPSRTDRAVLSLPSNVSLITYCRQIQHHLETIGQLRQEATQWKNQCLRLEETSRQEAISWKEQFLRVEQERSKLAQRVEELVAERLASVCCLRLYVTLTEYLGRAAMFKHRPHHILPCQGIPLQVTCPHLLAYIVHPPSIPLVRVSRNAL